MLEKGAVLLVVNASILLKPVYGSRCTRLSSTIAQVFRMKCSKNSKFAFEFNAPGAF